MSKPQPLTLLNTYLPTGHDALTSLCATTSHLPQKLIYLSNMEDGALEISSASYGTLCSLASVVIELFATTLLFNNWLISIETTTLEG